MLPPGAAAARGAEQQAEVGALRTEALGGREGEIDLQRVGEQEHAVDRQPTRDVEERHGLQLALHARRPAGEGAVARRHVVDREREVDVRPAVDGVARFRTHHRSSHDRRILVGPAP
ncbi:MAG: hypothetical protein R3F05_02665 [Planctomycetota bacterium]